MRILILAAAAALLVGCGGTVDSLSSSFGGVTVKEVHTKNLLCATAQFGDRVSVSCTPKASDPDECAPGEVCG